MCATTFRRVDKHETKSARDDVFASTAREGGRRTLPFRLIACLDRGRADSSLGRGFKSSAARNRVPFKKRRRQVQNRFFSHARRNRG